MKEKKTSKQQRRENKERKEELYWTPNAKKILSKEHLTIYIRPCT